MTTYMKKCNFIALVFAALLLGNIQTTNAQVVQWAKKGISEGFENGNAIVADDSGNVYVTGQFEFTSIFDTYVLNTYGQHDIFVVKYGPDGVIKWIRKAGGKGGDIGNGIGIDSQHNVYVTGEIEDTVTFGSGVSLHSAGANDGFIAKYDAGGNILWAKRFGTAGGSEKGRAISVTPAGDIYFTGNFSTSTDFGSTTLSSSGGNDICVVKMNTNGGYVWAKKAGGSSQDRGYAITIDAAENVYVAGTFTQSATFKNTTITNSGNHSSFLAKYDLNGSFQWVKSAGDCCDTTKANSIALDDDGNIYMTGYFMDHTEFGSYNFTSRGFSDAFVVKYNPSGNVIWARQAGGYEEDGAYGIAVDNKNHRVLVTGLIRESGNFDSIPYTVIGYKDVFIAAYDFAGNIIWLENYGGHYRDVGFAITVDQAGYMYSTGLFNDDATFGSFVLTGYPNQPWADFYVDKISPAIAPSPSNPATDLSVTSGNCADLNISFTPGNGEKRMIIMKEGSAVNSFPVNGNNYTDDYIFGDGSNLGNDNYVVYNGTGNNVVVTGLTPGATYYVSVIEYNGYGMATNYMTSASANGSAMASIFAISVSGLQNSVCFGDSLDLQATDAWSCTWYLLNGTTLGSGSSIIVKPQMTTTYKVNGNNADGCYSESTFTVTVNPAPVVNFSPLNSVCINSPAITLSGGSPAGGIYSGTGVIGNVFSPMTTGSGTFALQYSYTDPIGCRASAMSTIQVHSLPGVILTSMPSVCQNAMPITLTNGSPAGGSYSGNGVTAGIFNPAVGQGAFQIAYSYTNQNGCMGTASTYVVVKAAPSVTLGNDVLTCADNSVILDAGTGFNTYSWSTGSTSSTIILDSSGTGLGTRIVMVEVSNSSACLDRDTMSVTFDLCAGINLQSSEINNISIYPNPFRSGFTFKSDKTVSFLIYDMCGRVLYKENNFSGSTTVGENLSPGMYFVDVLSGTKRKIYSIVKSE